MPGSCTSYRNHPALIIIIVGKIQIQICGIKLLVYLLDFNNSTTFLSNIFLPPVLTPFLFYLSSFCTALSLYAFVIPMSILPERNPSRSSVIYRYPIILTFWTISSLRASIWEMLPDPPRSAQDLRKSGAVHCKVLAL